MGKTNKHKPHLFDDDDDEDYSDDYIHNQKLMRMQLRKREAQAARDAELSGDSSDGDE